MFAKKTPVVLFCAIAVILLLSGLIIYPLYRNIKKSSERLFSLRKDILSYAAQSQHLAQFKQTYKQVQPDLQKIDSLFIAHKSPVEFIEFVEQTANGSGLAIDISTSGLKQDSPWSSMAFQIELTGSFSKCLQFVKKIESSPYLIEIQSLRIKKVSEQELKKDENLSLGDVSAILQIKVFVR